MANLKTKLEALPRRIEPISGQNFSYVKLEDVLAIVGAHNAEGDQISTDPMDFFTANVDKWGAAEWFDRLAKAIRNQDKAVCAKDDFGTDMYRNIAASSAMRLVRDYEQQVRSALSPSGQISGEAVERGWQPIETAPMDGSWVLLYWPTMPINLYPSVGFHHGDEYGWEMVADREYGEVIPTHWMTCPITPEPKP